MYSSLTLTCSLVKGIAFSLTKDKPKLKNTGTLP